MCCMYFLYKGNGDKYECSNSRFIRLLSVVGKLYCRLLNEREGTECAIEEAQCGHPLAMVEGAWIKCLM